MMIEVVKKKDTKPNIKQYTIEEYFRLEEKSPYKNEFVNGKIIPMAGGTYNHNRISLTIMALLFAMLNDREDEVELFSSDQTIYIPDFNKVVYPDGCVAFGELESHNDKKYGLINPTLVIEVSSKSTERYDRTSKFRMYKSLPSFTEYVIVNQDMPIVEVFYKINQKKWQVTSYIGLNEIVKFETVNVELKMADIYKKAKDLKDPQLDIDFLEKEKD